MLRKDTVHLFNIHLDTDFPLEKEAEKMGVCMCVINGGQCHLDSCKLYREHLPAFTDVMAMTADK